MSRQQQKQRTRERLLAAAETVFRRDGFHRATVEGISDEAGYSKGAFYANFKDKEALFLALVETRLNLRALAIRGANPEECRANEQAVDLAQGFAAYAESDPGWQQLFFEFWVHASRYPEVGERFDRAQAPLREALSDAVRERITLSPTQSPRLVADAIWASLMGVALESMRAGSQPQALAETVITGLLRGLSAGGASP
ncbi:MAG: TetR/AcrR family transcriptional regulator [Mycobacteriales bacterium]